MAEVYRPPPKRSKLSELMEIGGGIAGGIAGASGGGPPGAIAGAAVGSSLGGTIGNIVEPPKETPRAGGSESKSTALMRRQQQIAQDNLATLKSAEQNLTYLPEDLRQEYAPAIMRARYLEEQRRGLV